MDVHADGVSLLVVKVDVVLRVPLRERLIKTIHPIRRSWEIPNLVHWYVIWNKNRHWVRDEHIRLRDLGHQMIPDILLCRALNIGEVGADLDVRAVEDWTVWR